MMDKKADDQSPRPESVPTELSTDYAGQTNFPIVAIGASAGGVEALTSFFGKLPENSGLAFVVIQHMDPQREDLLAGILQNASPMKVVQSGNHMQVAPNCVYTIPPNKKMTIQNGFLHLYDYYTAHTRPLPIDLFFQSLAEDRGPVSIGVILSGTGVDGTTGIKAIKGRGGAVFVQDPGLAQFDGMPRSAIATGLVDYVGAAESIPDQILAHLASQTPGRWLDLPSVVPRRSSYDKILDILQSATGHGFGDYKKNTVQRRITRRMNVHGIDRITTYVRFLRKNPQEVNLLFKELLIGVTSFFRDPAEWQILKTKVIPELVADRPPGKTIRVWVPGCATGEEAYSIAIIFKEVMESRPEIHLSMQIFATDLDQDTIDKAREGIFPASIADQVSEERLEKYFTKVNGGYEVIKGIRDMIIFARQNLIKDPPFTKLDLLSCRNLLIYLVPEMQKKLIPLFHYSLNTDGFLFLGSAETVGGFGSLFKPVQRKSRLFQRQQSQLRTEPVIFPAAFAITPATAPAPAKTVENITVLADKLILQAYAPATVLVNDNGDIIYISGRTGKYLEPAAGKVNWNIFAMAREGLYYPLTSGFRQALQKNEEVTFPAAVVKNEGGSQLVDIAFNPLQEPEALRGTVLVVFNDRKYATGDMPDKLSSGENLSSSQRESELERELTQVRQMWQAASAEMQLSQEELKSSYEELQSGNEELQSTNEELQSTNEELTTSQEEIQFLNEELKALNYELIAKLEELAQANNDMRNLLDSTNIATLFLDNWLCVKSFTKQMSVISKLIGSDVGRPVTDIASRLFYPQITEDVKGVLETLHMKETPIEAENGAWFNVRIQPYRTLENKIDGVVITFVDITEAKELEARLLNTQALLQQKLSNQGDKLTLAQGRLAEEITARQREVAAGRDPDSKE